MAKYLQGISGAFTGKVGPVVGCIRDGIPYMRSMAKPRTGPPSEKELINRNHFANMHAWLQPLLIFLRVGFAGYAPNVRGFLAAKSYNLKNASIQGEIKPERVKVSSGDLPLSKELSVLYQDAKMHFSWSNAQVPGTNEKDQIMLLAYHPESRTAIFDTHGSFRNVGNQILDTYREFIGKTVHVYAAFVSADRTRQSDSLYLGEIAC